MLKILMLILCLSATPALAATLPIVNKMQNFYEQSKGFSADFTQILEHKESGSKEQRKGKISFLKPLSIRWQTVKPHEETLVVTNREIWDYIPDEEIVYRYPASLAQDSRSIIQVITGQAPVTKDFSVKSQGTEKGLEKLILYPNEPTTQMVEGAIWVDPATGRILRARIVDFYGNANNLALENIKQNPKFGASEFKFTPPPGVEVEDRIESTVEEKALFN